jgi:hypothetical protein
MSKKLHKIVNSVIKSRKPSALNKISNLENRSINFGSVLLIRFLLNLQYPSSTAPPIKNVISAHINTTEIIIANIPIKGLPIFDD